MATNKAELERINRVARGDIIPTQMTRRDWAATWSARISAMLDAPAKKNATSRLFRLRFFQDGHYLVATLVQQLVAPHGVPSDQAVKVSVVLVRPYSAIGMSGGAVASLQLAGQYSVDEIVAFMRLDLLDPDAGDEFRDETRYSEIITVSRLIAKHAQD